MEATIERPTHVFTMEGVEYHEGDRVVVTRVRNFVEGMDGRLADVPGYREGRPVRWRSVHVGRVVFDHARGEYRIEVEGRCEPWPCHGHHAIRKLGEGEVVAETDGPEVL